jgi:type IV secretory pathway VirB10-like protein
MIPLHHGADDTTPFPPHLPEPDCRLHGGRLALVVGIIGCCLVALVGYRLFSRESRQDEVLPAPLPTESEVTPVGEPVPDRTLTLPQGYAGWDRRPQEPPPPIPEAQRVMIPQVSSQAPPGTVPPLVSGQPIPTATTGPVAQQSPPNGAGPRTPASTPPLPPEKPHRYLFHAGNVAKSPFGTPDGEQSQGTPGIPSANGTQADPQGGTLIKHAQWEKPAEVTKVWYMSQSVQGLTATDIVSDIGGPVVIRVTRDLQDKFLHGHTLIPQHSLILAEQAGQPQFGASRLAVTLKQVELPDGSVLPLKSKVADATGAQGVTGSTDYHWGRVLAGAGLSALLSIGTRVPTGNQEGFAPSIGQETTRQLGADVARTGNKLVDRELNIAPTITIPMGTRVTIRPEENLSLRQSPRIIK